MTLIQIIEAAVAAASAHPVGAVLAVVGVLLGSTITVNRMELPVWRWARDWINSWLDGLGKRLTASLMAKIDKQGQEIDTLKTTVGQLLEAQQKAEATADRRRADDYRREILSFNREIMEGRISDRESYVETLAIIDRYHDYCRENPDYPNSRADAAIRNIKTHYDWRMKAGFRQEE